MLFNLTQEVTVRFTVLTVWTTAGVVLAMWLEIRISDGRPDLWLAASITRTWVTLMTAFAGVSL